MDKLQSPQAKLLYLTSELAKQNEINEAEKTTFKAKVLSNDAEVMKAFEDYTKNNDEAFLRREIIRIVRPESATAPVELPPVVEEEKKEDVEKPIDVPPGQEDPNSPLGSFLMEKKRKFKDRQNEIHAIQEALKPAD
eukprot:TRINITY_DN1324_c0_g4_i2.p1 TRINITY_DN1324_c0_g4~~TRINITY_DN1324_c0_g4_i2.p1  ORF type:complete len:137 (-),score=54.13 TRINITY_DN1324_c0_g4_i2:156-566(-)